MAARPRLLVRIACMMAALGPPACTTSYGDTGSPAPSSWWPWVCPDGAPAPDSGCPPSPPCSDAGTGDDAGDAC